MPIKLPFIGVSHPCPRVGLQGRAGQGGRPPRARSLRAWASPEEGRAGCGETPAGNRGPGGLQGRRWPSLTAADCDRGGPAVVAAGLVVSAQWT